MLQTDEATAQHRRDLIARYPLVQYVPIEERDTHSMSRPSTQFLPVYLEDYQAKCDICLVDFSPPSTSLSSTSSDVFEPVMQLPCTHVFHATCIGQWLVPDMSEDTSDVDLVSRNHSCPSCRTDIRLEVSTKHSNFIVSHPEDSGRSSDQEYGSLNTHKILRLIGRRR